MPAEINTVSKPSVFYLTEGCQEYTALSSEHVNVKLGLFFFFFFPQNHYHVKDIVPQDMARGPRI